MSINFLSCPRWYYHEHVARGRFWDTVAFSDSFDAWVKLSIKWIAIYFEGTRKNDEEDWSFEIVFIKSVYFIRKLTDRDSLFEITGESYLVVSPKAGFLQPLHTIFLYKELYYSSVTLYIKGD